MSLENPQSVFNTSGYSMAASFPSGSNGVVLPTGGFANVNNPGGSSFGPTVNYSDAVAPGAAQLPDATIQMDGTPAPIPEIQALLGVVAHPIPSIDLYAYVGTEQEQRTSFIVAGKGYGYGSPLFVNSGCSEELTALACIGNISGVTQGARGAVALRAR